jgi:hypothetical protein
MRYTRARKPAGEKTLKMWSYPHSAIDIGAVLVLNSTPYFFDPMGNPGLEHACQENQ